METLHDMSILDTVVRELEKRLVGTESEIQKLNSQFEEWSRKAHAHCPSCGTRSLRERKHREKPFSELPLPEAVLICLSEYDYPINARTLRLKLEEKGYPRPKLGHYGNYLHTVICRLIEAGRMMRLEGDEIVAI